MAGREDRGVRRALAVALLLWVLGYSVAAAEGPRFLYHSPQAEQVLWNRLRAARLPLPVLRVGVLERGGAQFAMTHFLVGTASRPAVRRQAIRTIRAAFEGIPGLVQIDLAGLDQEETRERRAEVLFSVSARRERLAGMSPVRPPGGQLAAFGNIYFSPSVPLDPEPVPVVARVLRRALPGPSTPEGLVEARVDLPAPGKAAPAWRTPLPGS